MTEPLLDLHQATGILNTLAAELIVVQEARIVAMCDLHVSEERAAQLKIDLAQMNAYIEQLRAFEAL